MEEKKYIHYCWFGGKPLPKLAKKCIKSWKKYLPDYEIICWNESNVDLDECPFIRGAYDNKKWAFVADYARAKAMYEYGGIYFDTDMEIIKPIDFLFDSNTFLGVEDSGNVACGVWYEKNKKSLISHELLKFYRKQEKFDVDNVFNFSIPKLITDALSYDKYSGDVDSIKKLKNNIIIYPREYFYPYSYDRQDNKFTENTCMIHYYDASWVPKGEQKTVKMIRKYGKKNAFRIIKLKSFIKKVIKKIFKLLCYPLVLAIRKKRKNKFFEDRYLNFVSYFKDSNCDYVAFYNKDWLGTANATKDNFSNSVALFELYKGDNVKRYAEYICSKKFNLIIFSAFSIGWKELVVEIKKIDPNVKIKIIWHGSNAMHCEDYDWEMFNNIFELLNKSLIESIGFVKKSMYELYKARGFNVEFVMNNIDVVHDVERIERNDNKGKVRVGLYASGNRWVKNFYNQFAGAALVDNAIIDCIPLNKKIKDFASLLNVQLTGEINSISRNQLLKRLSQNDINIYCTFVECAPLLPIESFEMGVPCITSNNHHYWDGTELEEYLIVNKNDNSCAIHDQIEKCLKNKEKVMKLYAKWKDSYMIEYKKNIKMFLTVDKRSELNEK